MTPRLFEALEARGESGWMILSCSPSSWDVCLGSAFHQEER